MKVDFKASTPMGVELELREKLRSIEGRKIWVDMTLSAGDALCATRDIFSVHHIQHRPFFL
ncbi:hypothetical protein [Flavobacterium microcysteis]